MDKYDVRTTQANEAPVDESRIGTVDKRLLCNFAQGASCSSSGDGTRLRRLFDEGDECILVEVGEFLDLHA